MNEQKPEFDFSAFRDAFERKDAHRWVQFYPDDAEWIEYKPSAPSRDLLRMIGRKRIAEFIAALERSDIKISLSNEVLGRERAAFSVGRCDLTGRKAHVRAHDNPDRRGEDSSPG